MDFEFIRIQVLVYLLCIPCVEIQLDDPYKPVKDDFSFHSRLGYEPLKGFKASGIYFDEL